MLNKISGRCICKIAKICIALVLQMSLYKLKHSKKIDCNIGIKNKQSTPDKSNLQGKSKKVRVIGSSSYWEFEANNRK